MLGRLDEAIADYTAVIATYPDLAEFYQLRACCYEAAGKAERARADQEKAAQLAPDDGAHLNDRAWRLLTGPGEQRAPSRALVLARRALAGQPDNPVFLGTLGAAQYRLGQYREAAATLRRGQAAGRPGPSLFFLALARARLGDPAGARECLERAVGWARGQGALSPEDDRQLRDLRAEAETLLRKVAEARASGGPGG
jgi:tetratricopeptide (TPR) repeat protein